MKKINRVCILLLIYNASCTLEANIVALFFKPLESADLLSVEKAQRLVSTPGLLSRYLFKKQLNTHTLSGICASYLGSMAISNINGQLTFDRKQIRPEFYILVTPIIKPVFMIGNTIHHLETAETQPKRVYQLTYQADAPTGIYFWKTMSSPLFEHNIIPLNAVIIFADPDDVYIPEGSTIVSKQIQLALPDIYVKKSINRINHALWLLNIRQFFGSVKLHEKQEGPLHQATVVD
ncbi:MAG: hypothetical protein WCE21_05005 [Candidatus Babeliales bacterium]